MSSQDGPMGLYLDSLDVCPALKGLCQECNVSLVRTRLPLGVAITHTHTPPPRVCSKSSRETHCSPVDISEAVSNPQ